MSTKQLIVNNDPKAQTISIQVALPNAREAASIANDLAHSLVAQQNAYIQQQYTNELKLLDGHIADDQKNITTLNQQIIQLSSYSTPAQNASVIQQDQNQVTQNQNLLNQDINTRQTLLSQKALDNSPLSVEQVATPPSKPSLIIGLISLAQLILGVMFILGATAIYLLEKRRAARQVH